jgi:hypothetical protein
LDAIIAAARKQQQSDAIASSGGAQPASVPPLASGSAAALADVNKGTTSSSADEDSVPELEGGREPSPRSERAICANRTAARRERPALSKRVPTDSLLRDEAFMADEGSESSEDEKPPRNTVGTVPLEWYEQEEHIGYDRYGR